MYTKTDARRAERNSEARSRKLADGSFTAKRRSEPKPRRIEAKRDPLAWNAIQKLLYSL